MSLTELILSVKVIIILFFFRVIIVFNLYDVLPIGINWLVYHVFMFVLSAFMQHLSWTHPSILFTLCSIGTSNFEFIINDLWHGSPGVISAHIIFRVIKQSHLLDSFILLISKASIIDIFFAACSYSIIPSHMTREFIKLSYHITRTDITFDIIKLLLLQTLVYEVIVHLLYSYVLRWLWFLLQLWKSAFLYNWHIIVITVRLTLLKR